MPDSVAQREWISRVLGVDLTARPAGGGLDKIAKSWRATQANVDADLAAFCSALVSHPSVKDDPRVKFVATALAELPRLLPKAGEVQAVLDRPGEGAAGRAIAAVNEYRQALGGAQALAKLEAYASRSLKLPLTVRATLTAGLDEMEAALRAAA